MIDTQNSKPEHYVNGSFSIGTGPETVVVLGSCRVVPYVNYLDYLNAANRFTIHLINVVNFYYDAADKPVDTRAFTATFEANEKLRQTLAACKWFIHEHTENFGMFNTSRQVDKNIYQFGMQPEVDVSIPNFNNTFILFQEHLDYDADIRNQAVTDLAGGELGGGLQEQITNKGLAALEEFLRICHLTDLPEMADLFRANWRATRYFWSGNHISNHFTSTVFRLMNEKFLHLPAGEDFWARVMSEDLYATPCVPVTKYDVTNYGLTWPQAVEELRVR